MKKIKLFALCVLAFSFLMFTGCNDNNDDNTSAPYIEGTLTDWERYNLDSVRLLLKWVNDIDVFENFYLSSSEVTNGYFKLVLPFNITDKYLVSVRDYYDQEVAVSDTSALMDYWIEIEAYRGGFSIGSLVNVYRNENDNSYNEMTYKYASKAVRITGTITYSNAEYSYDMNLSKGWNRVYYKTTAEYGEIEIHKYELSTNAVSGLTWKFYMDGDI